MCTIETIGEMSITCNYIFAYPLRSDGSGDGSWYMQNFHVVDVHAWLQLNLPSKPSTIRLHVTFGLPTLPSGAHVFNPTLYDCSFTDV
jgi:hypothetical protein